MIASVRGEVLASGADWVVLSVGGVGLRLEIPAGRSRSHVGEEKFMHTHLVVREDSLTLFGFESLDEVDVFGILLGVSGVGPRSALGVLTALSPAEIAAAVVNEDEKPFRKVSGIGPKTAKLMLLQLAGKLDPQRFSGHMPGGDVGATETPAAAASVIAGLVNLGYLEAQAVAAVRDAESAGAPAGESGLLRAALALLQAPRNTSRAGSQS